MCPCAPGVGSVVDEKEEKEVGSKEALREELRRLWLLSVANEYLSIGITDLLLL
jgi:hypothetical protein